MSAGRTTWWPKDAAWHRRERIVELGEAFGAAGPNVVDVLCAWAQEQRASGSVRGGFRSLAREAFVDVADVRAIVERAAELGALDDLEIEDVTAGHGRFVCRVSGWQSDQERGRAAFRKQAQRDRETASHGESQPDHRSGSGRAPDDDSESRPVTESPPPDLTRQERTEAPLPPEGERKREKAAFENDMREWAEEHFPAADPRLVAALAAWLRSKGIAPTVEAMREYGREHPAWAVESQEPAAA